MCGIIASLTRDAAFFQHLVAHRGTRTRYSWPILHRRLPIVGLSTEYDQPVKRDQWLIGFVGEILDFREVDAGYKCDVELVAKTWVKEGPKGFTKHDGFWSIVAYNSFTGHLHILVDYLNQKPLFYRTDNGSVASEPDAAAAMGDVTADELYFAAVQRWGFCPDTERTPYNEVKKTRPGEHVVLTSTGVLYREIVDTLTPTDWNLRDEFEKAVRRRVLSADVPVACLVSGGFDSSLVYSFASRYAEVRPYYVGDDENELDRIADVIGDSPLVKVNWPRANDDKCIDIMQEPIDLGSLVPQIGLSEVVKETVCLTGDGADECFGGYGRAEKYDSQQADIWYELVNWHLPRLDRVMMRHCIEVRSPFLARRVVEAAMSLPREKRRGKNYLKELFATEIPMSVILAKKIPLREEGWDQHRRSISLVKLYRERYAI